MQTRDAEELLKKFLDGTISAQELALLESWYLNGPVAEFPELTEEEIREDLTSIRAAIPVLMPVRKPVKLFPRIAAVAALFLVIASAAYFFGGKHDRRPAIAHYTQLIRPGSNKAILILDDGSKVNLHDAKTGKLTAQGNAVLSKTRQGELRYDSNAADGAAGEAVRYNTITTPLGGQYQVTLSDGTAVWLNAGSSLKFPTAFTGGGRRVELQGEAYFEVAENKKMPFSVVSSHQTIEVLGTHFNVSAYEDDQFSTTTLLKGSVKLNGQLILKPGQQSVMGSGGMHVTEVNTENAIAWKKGKFKFINQNIKDLMKIIARWYDVQVIYQGEVTHQDFSGSVSRFDNISSVLDLLESTNTVHFKVEGRRITVTP